MNKPLSLLALAAVAPSALASYDLVMVVDAGDHSIKRFDGETGTYFGSFGGGILVNPRGFDLDPNNPGQLIVADVNTNLNRSVLRRFNYFTGEHLASYIVGGTQITGVSMSASGSFYSTSTGELRRFNPTSGATIQAISTGLPGTYDVEINEDPPAQFGSTDFINTTSPAGNDARAYTYDFANNTSSYAGNTTISSPRGNATSPGRFHTYAYGSNLVSMDATSYSAGGLLTQTNDLAAGHQLYYVAGTTATGGAIARLDYAFGGFTSSFGQGQLINPTYVQVHMAPEPATLLAFGLPALALLRRRKRTP